MSQRTKSQMYPLVEQWQASGQSQQQFSQAHGLSPHILQYWASKYRRETGDGESTIARAVSTDFVPLVATAPRSTGLVLYYPNGVRLDIPPDLSLADLAPLLKLAIHV